jgi:1-acyl-sn-glycerol-3-phosphate acyltransferase
MKPNEGFFSNWVFYTASFCMWVYLRFKVNLRSLGVGNIPREGACIIAANHASYIDPPAITSTARGRVVRFLARDTLFKGFAGWVMKNGGCVPIDRSRGDVGALRKSLTVLAEGWVLALFPEGTRSLTGELQPAKSGIGFLIAKAGVPVVPTYISGSFDAFPKGTKKVKKGQVTVIYGPPIMPTEFRELGSTREAYERIAALVMERIAALKPAKI